MGYGLWVMGYGLLTSDLWFWWGLFTEGLAGAEVGEEVSGLLVIEVRGEAFGHEGEAGRFERIDTGTGDGDILAIESAYDHLAGVLLDDETGERTVVGGIEREVFVAFADFCAGVDDGEEEAGDIVPVEAGEVGADIATLAKECMA